MKWGIELEKDRKLLTITASGIPDTEGFRSYLEAVASSLDWRPRMPVLCDFRELDTSQVTVGALRQIVDLHKEFADKHGSNPIAVVVSRPVDFGMVRMFEAYTQDIHPDHEVFYSLKDALK